MIKYNTATKVVFANDDALTDGIIEIQPADIAGYVADGAVVDSSAQAFIPAASVDSGVTPSVAATPADPAVDAVPTDAGGADSATPLVSSTAPVTEPSTSSTDSTSASSDSLSLNAATPSSIDPVASADASAVNGVTTPVVPTDSGVADADKSTAASDAPATTTTTSSTPVDAVAATPAGTAVPVATDDTPSSVITGTAAVAASDPTNPSVTGAAETAPVIPAEPDATISAADKAKQEQDDAAAGVDTTRDVGTVTLTPDNLGSVTGLPVTPDGTPVVDAQPQAVTVAGAVYPANAPGVAEASTDQSFVGQSHESMISKLLDDLEGIEAMGKSEIKFVVDSLRNAFHRKD